MSSGMSDAAKNIGTKSEEFVLGDWVYELCSTINLVELTASGRTGQPLRTINRLYLPDGRCTDSHKHPGIFKATTEVRQALVTLYGESAVPQLPLRGSELTKKLIDQQSLQIVRVSDESDADARNKNRDPSYWVAHGIDEESGRFLVNHDFDERWSFAVPYDIHGSEIIDLTSPAASTHKYGPDLKVGDVLRCTNPDNWFQGGARYIVAETNESLAMIDKDGDAWNYKEMRGRYFIFDYGDELAAFEKD